jgi:hypothetical protein
MVLGTAQRNNNQGSPITDPNFWRNEEGEREHPAALLFRIENLKDLVMKSDIPERMVPSVTRMLWKAERYQIPALTSLVEWYLIARLGKERQARQEFIELLTKVKDPNEEEALT